MTRRNQFNRMRGEQGASLVETALMLPLFCVLMFSSVDLARAFYLLIEVAGAAHAGAIYGSRNPTDTTGMGTMAVDAAPNVPGVSAGTPTCSVECPDGTHPNSSCTTVPTCASGVTYVYLVKVKVTGTYTPLFPWPGIPTSMPLSSSAAMRSAGS